MPLPWKAWSYQKVSIDNFNENQPDEQLEASEKQPLEKTSQFYRLFFNARNAVYLVVVICVFAILIAIGITNVHASDRTKSTDPVRLCGNSSAEALALGCNWNQLTWAWYPPNCPQYANDEYMAAEQWNFYKDMGGKELATGEDWVKGLDNKLNLYGQRREHLTHCVYLFLSIGQIVRDKTPYPPRLAEYRHLQHCAKKMLEALRTDPKWDIMETSAGRVSYEQYC